MKRKIIIGILLLLISVNIISIIIPISNVNSKEKSALCIKYGLINDNANNKYVTRDEFLESLLNVLGLNDDIYTKADSVDYSSFPTDDFMEGMQHCPTPNTYINDNYFANLYGIAQGLNCLQTYCINSNERDYKLNLFYGKNYITVHEAIVMIESCLREIQTEDFSIHKNSFDYWGLLLKSRFSGILLPIDSSYWTFCDSKLKREDMCCLLCRLLQKKRYKYLSVDGHRVHSLALDEYRNITYLEYLKQQLD